MIARSSFGAPCYVTCKATLMPLTTDIENMPPAARLFLYKVALFRNIQTIQELPDILVSYSANLLDVGGALRDVLEGISEQDELILLCRRHLNVNSWLHDNSSDDLLANEVSDFDLVKSSLVVLVYVDVDGEMCVDISHLVSETLGDANDQVIDEGSDSSEGSNVLSGAMVKLDVDNVFLRVREIDGQVAQVLGEFTSWTFDCDLSRLDGDLDTLRDGQGLIRMNVLHLGPVY